MPLVVFTTGRNFGGLMNVRIYHNPRCSKSRQTLAMLREKGIEPEVIEYLKTPPDESTLRDLLKQLELEPSELLREKEILAKELGLTAGDMTEDEVCEALLENPILIERPIVVTDKGARIGRPPEAVFEIL